MNYLSSYFSDFNQLARIDNNNNNLLLLNYNKETEFIKNRKKRHAQQIV